LSLEGGLGWFTSAASMPRTPFTLVGRSVLNICSDTVRPNAQLLAYVESLGKECQRRGLLALVEQLRTYYWALQRGRVAGGAKLELLWSPERVEELMATFQLPPFQGRFRIQPRNSHCERCRERPPGNARADSPFVEMTFPGGARVRCSGCGARWLELDRN
jgi:hypothetical protein